MRFSSVPGFVSTLQAVLDVLVPDAAILQPPPDAFQAKCGLVADLFDSDNVTVISSEFVKGGALLRFPNVAASCFRTVTIGATTSTDICRVVANITTSPETVTVMETWMPRNWTKRMAATGNGGINGCIKYTDMAYGNELGFVTVGSNNGHNGNTAKYFLNNNESLADYGWRSYYRTAQVGKDIAEYFYDDDMKYSYAYGCSTGGREALVAAQQYPDVFDGFAGGAPTIQWSDLNSWSNHFLEITGNWRDKRFIKPQDWIRVHDEAVRQCDGNDGVIDGVIEDPHKCKFDPGTLLCKNGQTKDCLTDVQVQTARNIYKPFIGLDGKEVYSHMLPGSEGGRSFIYFMGYPNAYAQDWYRYAVLNNPNFSSRQMTLKDVKMASDMDVGRTNAWEGDLSDVKDNNKKIITWHGLMDSIIMSDTTIKYYEHVRDTMMLNYTEMDSFYRHFRIPGMDHCADGPGANQIGQFVSPPEVKHDPNKNPLLALVRWVEEGIPPDTIEGTKYVDKKPVVRRKHCRWPLQNYYVAGANGDPLKAESWKCKWPKKWFENGKVL